MHLLLRHQNTAEKCGWLSALVYFSCSLLLPTPSQVPNSLLPSSTFTLLPTRHDDDGPPVGNQTIF